jgi:hypothetical protein
MSIRVSNAKNQLNIETNGVLDVYNFDVVKSVSRAVDASGDNYISINFIANDKNNSLRIPLKEVVSPPTWTNDTTGAIQAVEDIRLWMDDVVSAIITSPIGQQSIFDSVSVAIASEQANVQVLPALLEANGITSGDLTAYLSYGILSISFANRGTDWANISMDGGSTYVRLYPGETLNMDANGIMNYYDPSLIFWVSPNAGSALLIAFNYI